MYDLVSVGSISIDLFFRGDSLTFKEDRFQLAVGGKYLADHFSAAIGGGGANVGIGVRRHGLRTAVMGKIGNNSFKKIILEKLDQEKVSHLYCDFQENYYNISAILLTKKGERSIIHFVSPHRHLIEKDSRLLGITKTKFLYLGNLPEVSLTEKNIFLNFFKQKKTLTAVNLGVTDCRRSTDQLKPFLNKVDILIINGHEFSELVKAPYKDIHFHENVINWYIPYLADQLVIVTEGPQGSFSYYQGKVYHQKAVKPAHIIDTTGAGDAYTSGFIAEYFKTSNIERAMFSGAKYAAKILEKAGAN